MDVLEDENKRYRRQLTKLGGNKVLRSTPRDAMFVSSFENLKSRSLSRDSKGDRVIPSAEVRVRRQVSHGNITVLSHLKEWGKCFGKQTAPSPSDFSGSTPPPSSGHRSKRKSVNSSIE